MRDREGFELLVDLHAKVRREVIGDPKLHDMADAITLQRLQRLLLEELSDHGKTPRNGLQLRRVTWLYSYVTWMKCSETWTLTSSDYDFFCDMRGISQLFLGVKSQKKREMYNGQPVRVRAACWLDDILLIFRYLAEQRYRQMTRKDYESGTFWSNLNTLGQAYKANSLSVIETGDGKIRGYMVSNGPNIYIFEVFEAYRMLGYGRAAIQAFRSAVGEVRAVDVIPEAAGFWKRVGVPDKFYNPQCI